ncbi:alkyl hydroperoxide reductase subunit AhpC [Salibacterium salarium]|uniref:peroxiredoxin n=1 Tax=Salibacterium salarium TaxID=284579 RepID=UPI00277FC888|nr:peroxiredoxin [Salibacterium salarium]MDQ0298960.1 alkyl hydroperoxide reductase subunit AhpC [Salibacterium salarium]
MTAESLIGKQAPLFTMDVVMPDTSFTKISLRSIMKKDKWTVLFFYPMDFTTICPTEITSISDDIKEFEELDAEVIGVSTDTIYSHKTWRNIPREEDGLGKIKYPLAADTNHKVSKDYGVFDAEEGIAHRGLFIISPEGEVMYAVVHHHHVGRDVDEILRVLLALQTGRPCPANWKPGQSTLEEHTSS